MADGTRRAIEQVKPGEEVQATDPSTGESGPRVVDATILGTGIKDLVDVTVGTTSGADTGATVVTATAGHPFWNEGQRAWIDAGQLSVGQKLSGASGDGTVAVTDLMRRIESRSVYNLSVRGFSTYYVAAGPSSVLVHNCGNASTHDVKNLADKLDDNVYFHYTNKKGHEGIQSPDGSLKIGANPAGKVHVTQEMNGPAQIENDIFIGSSLFSGKGDYVFAFDLPQGVELLPGSQMNELVIRGSLKIPSANVIFHGRNPF